MVQSSYVYERFMVIKDSDFQHVYKRNAAAELYFLNQWFGGGIAFCPPPLLSVAE